MTAKEILERYYIFSIDNPETQRICIIQAMEEYASQQPDLRRELIGFAEWYYKYNKVWSILISEIDEYLHSRTNADKTRKE